MKILRFNWIAFKIKLTSVYIDDTYGVMKKRYLMEELRNVLKESLNIEFISAVISNPREKGDVTKIKIRPVKKKDQLLFQ